MKKCTCFVIPPHIMHEMAQRATNPADRRRAMRTLTVSSQMQGVRTTVAAMPGGMAARAPGQLYRMVYDGQNKTRLPGMLVRREGAVATRDAAVDEAFDGTGLVYQFLQTVYRRKSLDDKGLMLPSTVHFAKEYDNAFWNGSQLAFGDGDNHIFNRFTASLTVIAHELIHGMTQYTSNLEYEGQSGALNEHLSDAFGAMVHQWRYQQAADQADWLIGQGMFTLNVSGKALRNMRNPGTAYDDKLIGKDPQPGHMRDYVVTDEDNEGVHINSGIPNRAFVLACLEVGGFSWEKMGRIWYDVASRKLWAEATFQDFANITTSVAAEMYGSSSYEHKAVAGAWKQVGLVPF